MRSGGEAVVLQFTQMGFLQGLQAHAIDGAARDVQADAAAIRFRLFQFQQHIVVIARQPEFGLARVAFLAQAGHVDRVEITQCSMQGPCVQNAVVMGFDMVAVQHVEHNVLFARFQTLAQYQKAGELIMHRALQGDLATFVFDLVTRNAGSTVEIDAARAGADTRLHKAVAAGQWQIILQCEGGVFGDGADTFAEQQDLALGLQVVNAIGYFLRESAHGFRAPAAEAAIVFKREDGGFCCRGGGAEQCQHKADAAAAQAAGEAAKLLHVGSVCCHLVCPLRAVIHVECIMCKQDERGLKDRAPHTSAGAIRYHGFMDYRETPSTCRAAIAILATICLFFLSLLAAPLRAAEVTGLYQASVPVVSRDDERERQQAFGTALRQVLVKLSGRTDTLDNPDIRRALGTVQTYVEAWAYRGVPALPTADPLEPAEAGIALEVTFFQTQLQSLLDAAGIPLWPQNRPDTLLWIVEQDATGQRTLVGNDSPVVAALKALAAERAMPLISPILDLQDRLALRPDVLWTLDPAAIVGASSRYRTDSVLVLRIMHLVSGDVIARAEHHLRGLVQQVDVLEAPLAPFLTSSIDLAARELASNYGVFVSGAAGPQDIGTQASLQVDGVDSVEDYAGVLRYLEGLAVVKSVQVASANGTSLVFDVNTGGQLRQLIETLALDRRLQALSEPVREGQRFSLSYQWQGP